MILSVQHVTHYRYAAPVWFAVQSHRLTPSVFDGQKVLGWQVMVSEGVRGGGFRDGAGDWVQGWTVRGPVDGITISVQGQVETRDLTGLLTGHRETIPPEAYLRPTHPTRADAALAELALSCGGTEALDQAHRLSAAVSDAIAYRPGTTLAETTAAEALAQGEGVCQDQAHALIAVARHGDIPARYVSGYLMAEGASGEASHAWAELWIRGLGWIGFDPANRCCPDDRYIRLGSGYDAQDAAPIRGFSSGLAAESLDVTVAVQTLQQ